MTFLRQFLPYLCLPFTVSLAVLIVGHVKRRPRYIWAAVALLWISSTPVVASALVRVVEGGAERRPAADAPTTDAIVVLSGARVIAPGAAAISEWNDADRFFGGLELYRAGKAPLLVFTGARPIGPATAPSEGETAKQTAMTLGVPADHVVTTGLVINTEDEAREVAALLGRRSPRPARVLLVTSAFHMARAQRLFERAGLTVSPFPVDFQRGAGNRLGMMDFLPSAAGLQQTQVMLRELYGRMFYRVIGQ